MLCVALVVGAIIMPKYTFHRMTVTYVNHDGHVSLVDSSGDVYGIFADGVEVGDSLLCYCVWSGDSLKVLDYIGD